MGLPPPQILENCTNIYISSFFFTFQKGTSPLKFSPRSAPACVLDFNGQFKRVAKYGHASLPPLSCRMQNLVASWTENWVAYWSGECGACARFDMGYGVWGRKMSGAPFAFLKVPPLNHPFRCARFRLMLFFGSTGAPRRHWKRTLENGIALITSDVTPYSNL